MSLCSTSSAFPQSLNPRHSSTSDVSPCRLSVLSQPLVFKNFSLPLVVVLDARHHCLICARLLVLRQSSLFKVCLTTPQSLSPIGIVLSALACQRRFSPHTSAISHLAPRRCCHQLSMLSHPSLINNIAVPAHQHRFSPHSSILSCSLLVNVVITGEVHVVGDDLDGVVLSKVSTIIVIVLCQYDNISLKSHWKSTVMQI